jgi:type VI secretion system protein ImpL
LSGLLATWPYALAAVLLVALVVLVLLVLLLKRSAATSRFADAAEEGGAPAPAANTAPAVPPPVRRDPGSGGRWQAFRRARHYFDRSLAGNRQAIPCFLLLGAAGSRDPDLLADAGLDLPFGTPAAAGTDLGDGRGFWLFSRGAILDLAGDEVLGADGRSSDETGWRTSLHQLQRLRPRRPADGVILTLPCGELLAAAGGEAARTELATRAALLCHKLWGAQQRLGFRLPVYALVTGCEGLPGFTSFCAALPPALRQEMLGWSSPYVADAAYHGDWVGEAVAALGARLNDLQMESFAEGAAGADQLFLLPAAVRSLGTGLTTALDQLFVPSAYHESILFRGLFLCGRAGGAGDGAAEPPRRTLFLKDLLEAKVFPEAALAVPSARAALSRNRAVRVARALTAVAAFCFAGGLLWAHSDLDHKRKVLSSLLGDTRLHLRELQRAPQDMEPTAELAGGAYHLLLKMNAIDFNFIGNAFVPSSWFSPFRAGVRKAITNAYDKVILLAIRRELEAKARALYSGSLAAAGPAADPPPGLPVGASATEQEVQPIERLAEFGALQRFVAGAREVEANAHTFNDLKATKDLHALDRVVRFAFGTPLPETFFNDSEIYQRALGNANYQPFEPEPFRPHESRRAEELAADFYSALFLKSPLLARLETLSRELQQIAWQRPAPGDTASFDRLARHLRDLELLLSGPHLEWAFRREFDLGPAYAEVLAGMERCTLLEADTARQVRESGAVDWAHFQKLLAGLGSPLTGPLLAVRGGRLEMQLSPDAVLLETALDTLLGQGFLASSATARQPAVESLPPGTRSSWDAALLDQAAAAAAAYERFRGKGLDLFPADLRAAIEDVARERTQAQMVSLIAGAQSFRALPAAAGSALFEEEVRIGTADFTAALRPAAPLLETSSRLQLGAPRRALSRALGSEAYRLLAEVDRLLAAEEAYRPRQGGFAWWDGSSSPALPAWNAHDPAELAAYLETTRERIAWLARSYAQPLVAWLAKAGSEEPAVQDLAARWQRILDDLRDYEAKKVGNPVAALEDYVNVQMAKVRTADCAAAAPAAPARPGHDFFVVRLSDLERQLAARCHALAGEQAAARYAEIERYFNQRLAGRYPFAAAPPGAGEAEAAPEDVRAFFRLFDAGAPVVRALPAESSAFGPRLAEVRRFLDDMARVRAFFKPFLDTDRPPEQAPSFDVEPTFRILRERETGADQIIGWGLAIGDDAVTDREPRRKLRWTLGQPVRLSLRWASDGPRVPVEPAPRSGVAVADRTVIFAYANSWALLTALENRATRRELPDYADAEPVTLALTVYTKPAAGGPPPAQPARVFLRLELFAPAAKPELAAAPLEVPAFPVQAPRLGDKRAQQIEAAS